MSALTRIGIAVSLSLLISVPPAARAADSWTDLKPGSGRSNYGNGYRPVTAVRSGNVVTLSGLLNNRQLGTIATLPRDLSPDRELIFNVNVHNSSARVDVLPNGEIHMADGDTGTGWVSLDGIAYTLGRDNALRLENGWRNYGNVFADAGVRLEGDTVFVSGLVIPGKDQVIATLPPGMRPSKALIFNANGFNKTARVDVYPDGRIISVYRVPNARWVSLNGITFTRRPGQQLQLASGWQNYGQQYAPVTVTRTGNRVSLSGLARASSSNWGQIATLPRDMCPESRLIFNLNNQDHSSRVDVVTDCRIVWVAGGHDYGFVSLDGIAFDLKPASPGPALVAHTGGGLTYVSKQQIEDVSRELKPIPALHGIELSTMSDHNGVLSGAAKIGAQNATVYAWRPVANKPYMAAVLADTMKIGDLAHLRNGNKLFNISLSNVLIFAVPAGIANQQQRVSALPAAVHQKLTANDPTLADANATLTLAAGTTYYGGINTTGFMRTATDYMGLEQPVGVNGSLVADSYAAPQNTVTLTARFKQDPLALVLKDAPFKAITVAKSAKPELFLKATGTTDFEIGYRSSFKVFDQDLDSTLSFKTEGTGADKETAIAIEMSKPGAWPEPHLLGPLKVSNVTLNDAAVTYERSINNKGVNDSLSVETTSTKIHSTTYKPAAFTFTIDGTSAYPKAAYVNIATKEITIKQLAELAEVASQMTPQGQLAAIGLDHSPIRTSGFVSALKLDKLPLGLIKVKNPSIYFATAGAKKPDVVPQDFPPLPDIFGAGIYAKGKLVAFNKDLADGTVQADFKKLSTDTKIDTLPFGAFTLNDPRFKIDATPSDDPTASFSGSTTILGFDIASTTIDINTTGFGYDISTACVGAIKVSAKGRTHGFAYSIPHISAKGCVPEPAGAIIAAAKAAAKAAVDAGKTFVRALPSPKDVGDALYGAGNTAINFLNSHGAPASVSNAFADAWNGANVASLGKTARSVGHKIGSAGKKAGDTIIDTGKSATKKIPHF